MLQSAARRDQLDLDLARRYHDDHDLQARDELVVRLMPLIRTLAGRFTGRGETFEDLVQVGALGLVGAIERFDPSAGHRFVSFAAPTITGEMRRHFRDHCWAVHVPRSTQELAARIEPARVALADRDGREPTATAIAAHLSVPVDRVRDAIAAGGNYRARSLDAPTGLDGLGVLERHGAADPGYARVEDRDVVDRACEVLDERAVGMVRSRFFDEEPQRVIAEAGGVSQMQVSRILGASLTAMGQDLDPDVMLTA